MQLNLCGLTFTEPPVLGTSPVKTYFTVNPADYSRGDGRVYVVVNTTDGYTATYSRPGLVIGSVEEIKTDDNGLTRYATIIPHHTGYCRGNRAPTRHRPDGGW